MFTQPQSTGRPLLSSGRHPVGRHHQLGAGYFINILLLAIIGLVLVAGLRLMPAYIDNNVVVNAVEGVLANHDVDELSEREFRTEVMRTINVNNLDSFDAQSIEFTREGSNDYIDVNYETRVPLFYNIDAMVSFENRFDR